MSDIKNNHRVKFHGLGDMSIGFYAGLIPDILDKFDETRTNFSVEDVLELYNVLQFLQKGILPSSLPKKKQDFYKKIRI